MSSPSDLLEIDELTGFIKVRGGSQSRREFLSGGATSLLALAALGVGVVGLGSPGPNAFTTNFDGRYIKKHPTIGDNNITATSDTFDPFNITLAGTASGHTPFRTQGSDGKHQFVIFHSSIAGPGIPGNNVQIVGQSTDAEETLFVLLQDTSEFIPLFDMLNLGVNVKDQLTLGYIGFTTLLLGFGTNFGTDPTNPTSAVSGAEVGQPTGTAGTNPFAGMTLGGHRHPFSGQFFFNGFISDAALGGALPVIWQRSIIARAITLKRITVDSVTPSTGIGNDVVRVGDGTNFLSVNLGAGAATATATGTVNIASNQTLRIDVNGQNTVPAKLINVACRYEMQ